MHLFFITSELEPINNETGLGQYVAQLGGALCTLGHRVTVVIPLRSPEIVDKLSFARRLSPVEVALPNDTVKLHIFDGRLPSGVELRLLSHADLFENRAALTSDPDEPLRQAVLARAALQLALEEQEKTEPIHIVQSFGLPAALTPLTMKMFPELEGAKSILTLDSVENQGRCGKEWVDKLGLSWDDFTAEGFEFYGDLNLLKAGLIWADLLLFPGLELAQNLQRSAGGLEGVIQKRAAQGSVAALLPGADYSRWNPATDVHLPVRFDAMQSQGKRSCKAHLQNRLELPIQPDVPLIALAPPLETLADQLAGALGRIARGEVQIVAPRGLKPSLSAAVEKASSRWPRTIARPELDEMGWHQLIAGADLCVLDPPSGTDASLLFAALRYGALPIVHNVGLARELVVDMSGDLESGNGFLIHEKEAQSSRETLAVLRRATAALHYGEPFERALCRTMNLDCSWEHRAKAAEQIYAELLPTSDAPENDDEEVSE